MAGIYGILGSADPGELVAMGARLPHRGTAVREWSSRADLHLGLRSSDGEVALDAAVEHDVLFDGFLDNTDELLELLGAGARHREQPDCAWIARGVFERFGPAGFDRLAGHFAVVLWDKAQDRLILARDRYGARPLNITSADGRCLFASEYKALLAIPWVPARPNPDAIQYLQCTKFVRPDATFLRDVHPVPPGQWVSVSLRDTRPDRGTPYWSVQAEIGHRSEAELTALLRSSILDATRRQAAPYDPIGVSLSGGLDSAITLAALKHVAPEKTVHTFSAGFGARDREIVDAREMADHFGTIHHQLFLQPDELPDLLPPVVWYLEDPAGREETAFLYITSREAAPHVSMLLAGYGADLLFAGMPRHRVTSMALRYPLLRRPLEDFLTYTQTGLPPRSPAGKLLTALYYRGKRYPVPAVIGAESWPSRITLQPSTEQPLTSYLLDVLAKESVESKTERLHTAFGVAFNAPCMDPSIIACASQIPDDMRIRGRTQKYVLREAFRGLLPDDVVQRKKTLQKLQHDQEFSRVLESLAERYLSPADVLARGLIDPAYVGAVIRRTPEQAYSSERAYRIWSLIMTELWCRAFLDERGRRPPELDP